MFLHFLLNHFLLNCLLLHWRACKAALIADFLSFLLDPPGLFVAYFSCLTSFTTALIEVNKLSARAVSTVEAFFLCSGSLNQ